MSERTDAELAAAVRAAAPGHDDAFAELHRRHHAAVLRQARAIERDGAAAEDLVADAFADTLAALRRGAGPRESVRAYLMTAVRNGHADRLRARGRTTLPGDEAVLAAVDAAGAARGPGTDDGAADLRLVLQAYETLPERWRAVLWHVVVEGERPRHVARMLGITANAVSQLTARAREGLCEAYLGAHVGRMPEGCRGHGPRLGAYVRGTVGARERRVLERHLDGCAACAAVCAELVAANARLRVLPPPAVLGVAASSYAGKAGAFAGAAAASAGVAGTAAAAVPGPFFPGLKAGLALARRIPRSLLVTGGTATAVAVTVTVVVVGGEAPAPPPAAVPPVRAAAGPDPSGERDVPPAPGTATPAPPRATAPPAPASPRPSPPVTPAPVTPRPVAPATAPATAAAPRTTTPVPGPATPHVPGPVASSVPVPFPSPSPFPSRRDPARPPPRPRPGRSPSTTS